MECPKCHSTNNRKNGTTLQGDGVRKQKLVCKDCGHHYFAGSFAGGTDPIYRVLKFEGETQSKKLGLNEAELRAMYDNTFILKTVVKTLTKDNFIQERDFVLLCKFKGTAYRSAMQDKQFDPYHGIAGGVTYWGNKEDIQRLKDEGVLR